MMRALHVWVGFATVTLGAALLLIAGFLWFRIVIPEFKQGSFTKTPVFGIGPVDFSFWQATTLAVMLTLAALAAIGTGIYYGFGRDHD